MKSGDQMWHVKWQPFVQKKNNLNFELHRGKRGTDFETSIVLLQRVKVVFYAEM